jgi:putative transposase
MARLSRLTVAGYPHHIIQRGIDRREIFRDLRDHERMIADLRELSRQHALAIHAYVLMPNHLHLLATPADAGAVSKTMQSLGRRYVRWFNQRWGRTGTLWDGRFRCTVLDPDRYLLACARYVELNPMRIGLVADAAEYPWSSLAHHLGLRVDPLITEHPLMWSLGNTPFERQAAYRRLCETAIDSADLAAIRNATHCGWALGDQSFLQSLADRTTRRLVPIPVGRPKRSPQEQR